jgi:hypothetical protein
MTPTCGRIKIAPLVLLNPYRMSVNTAYKPLYNKPLEKENSN